MVRRPVIYKTCLINITTDFRGSHFLFLKWIKIFFFILTFSFKMTSKSLARHNNSNIMLDIILRITKERHTCFSLYRVMLYSSFWWIPSHEMILRITTECYTIWGRSLELPLSATPSWDDLQNHDSVLHHLGMTLRITTECYTIFTICFVDSRDDDDDDVFTDEAPSSSYEQTAEALSKSAKQRSQSLSALPKDDKSPKKVGAARVHTHAH